MFRPVFLLLSISLLLTGCARLQKQQEQNEQILEQVKVLQSSLEAQNETMEQLESQLHKVKKSVSRVYRKVKTIAKNSKPRKKEKPSKKPVCKQNNKFVVGEEEWVYLPVLQAHFKARVDSGATTSSISAKNIERFEKDGKKWVRFDLEYKGGSKAITLERPLKRRVAIKQSSTAQKESRLVISLMIKMGKHSQNTEFTLADRSLMDFPVLLGRSFLRDMALVDVSQQFIQPKFIPPAAPQKKQ